MPNEIKGLLFDKDGTLFDFHETWGVWCAGFINETAQGDSGLAARLATAMDFDLETGVFLPHSLAIAGTMDDMIDAVQTALPDWARARVVDYVTEKSSTVPQVPAVDLPPLLAEFKRRSLKIGVATNDGEVPAKEHLKITGILQAFDYVVGYDSGYGAKPAPGMVLGFCQAVGLHPREVVMVGDSIHDLRAGQAAGTRTIGVLTGMAEADDLAPYADVVLNDIAEIPAWLDTISLATD